MAEEIDVATAPPTGTEPVQNVTDRLSSEESVDRMLANIPGMAKYFGDADSDKKAGEPVKGGASAPSGEMPETAGAVVDEILSAGVSEKEPAAQVAGEEEKLPDAVQARIDRLTSHRRELEDSVSLLSKENAELKTKLSNAGARSGSTPTADNPLAQISSYEDLEQRLIDAKRAKTWALENLDGGHVEVNRETGETRELSGQEVKKLLALSDQLITDHIPRRKAYLDARIDFDRQADTYYPDYRKPDSELSRTLNAWVSMFPEMTKFPDFRLIVADALVGQKIRFGRLATKNGAGGSSNPKVPTLAAPSPSGSPRVPAKSVLSKDLLNRMSSDRSALDIFSESLIGTGTNRKK